MASPTLLLGQPWRHRREAGGHRRYPYSASRSVFRFPARRAAAPGAGLGMFRELLDARRGLRGREKPGLRHRHHDCGSQHDGSVVLWLLRRLGAYGRSGPGASLAAIACWMGGPHLGRARRGPGRDVEIGQDVAAAGSSAALATTSWHVQSEPARRRHAFYRYRAAALIRSASMRTFRLLIARGRRSDTTRPRDHRHCPRSFPAPRDSLATDIQVSSWCAVPPEGLDGSPAIGAWPAAPRRATVGPQPS